MALEGNDATIEVSVDDATYYAIDEQNSAAMNCDGENIDITKFGDSYRVRIQTVKDAGYSSSGFWVKTDTNGQIAIRTAWLNDSTLYVKITVDGTNGWKQLVKVESISVNTTADGATEIAFEFSGNGEITAVS